MKTRTETLKALQDVLLRRRGVLERMAVNPLNSDTDGDEEEVNAGLIAVEENELTHIEEALERVQDGTYGMCDDCGSKIPAARLEALPYALRCINCQRKWENNSVEEECVDYTRLD